jgi:hypothetical protein
MNTKDDLKTLVGEVQMFRIRIATAESKVKLLRDQNRQAKRRRKEAKRMAQRARKQFKRFKAELADLRQALAKAEVKLFQAGGRALARKTAKARLVAKRGTRLSKKSKTVARKARSALPRKSREPGRATRKKPPITEAKVVSEGPADVAALDLTSPTRQSSDYNSINL